MFEDVYPHPTAEIQARRKALAAEPLRAFHDLSRHVFAEGALSCAMKQIIAVAVAHVTQCLYCIRGHTEAALKAGGSMRRPGSPLEGGQVRRYIS